MSPKNKLAALTLFLLGCVGKREDIVFDAFTEPLLDWYSLKLYSNGDFDLHIPSIDYKGKYRVSGDTIFLKSIETSQRIVTTTAKGKKSEAIIKEQRWTFLIDIKRKRIKTIGNKTSPPISIDIVINRL